jgi:hypothetical protein
MKVLVIERFEYRSQDLLNDSVTYCRYPQLPHSSIVFRDFHPLDWLSPVTLRLQFVIQAINFSLKIPRKVTQALPINSGRAFRSFHVLESLS